MIVKGLREIEGVETLVDIFDIKEFTYSGKDMGERSITATINHPSPIDFRAGDFVEFQMQSLERQSGGMNGTVITEKFYVYTMPTVKKTANPMTAGDAFEHTLTLYPAQYELALVQMRNLGDPQDPEYIYTGFDEVTFVGGASMLMKRIKLVLDEAYGKNTWTYKIANEVNEEINTSLETFLFTFSGNTVMDALLKLNDKDGINTTFYINDRTIYVGQKRPYFCRVLDNGEVDSDINTQMFNMQYGKTSHEDIAINYGGLFEITKSVGKETPITKLFAYGAARNLNRYYCSDRIKVGRYVNRLMLPSFDADGKTDFVLSEKGIEKFGIREGSKQFDDIYPSLRYVTYGDIRQIKYCIKLKVSGLDGETKDNASFPLVRVQCYKVIPSDQNVGVNALVECAPPDDIAVYIHTLGSVVRVVLYGGRTNEEALAKQRAHDAIVPTRTKGGTDYIYGSCFAVYDRGFDEEGTVYLNDSRDVWFTNPNEIDTLDLTDAQKTEIELHQVTYFNTPAITDIYVFNEYHQDYFSRDGYSAWGWARLNANYVTEGGIIAHDSIMVNEIVAVEPIVIQDTEYNLKDGSAQQTFDIYLRDVGFKIDEQNDFGENVFVLNGDIKVSFLDGKLTGREFNVNGSITDFQSNCVCAFNDDGTRNDDFFEASGYTEKYIAEQAFADGAIWRLRLARSNMSEPDLSNLALAMPTPNLNAGKGDHIVLLDLFMPDIYIHAAENRLLREARQYLEANDNGSISYSVEFDKVRMHQIPQYALQIREGLNVRVQDEDLSITTENDVRKVFEGELVSNTSLYKTTYDSETVEKYYYTYKHRDYYDIEGELHRHVSIIGGVREEYIDEVVRLEFEPKFASDGFILEGYNCSIISAYFPRVLQSDCDNDNYDVVAVNNKMTFRVMESKVISRNGLIRHYVPTDNYFTLDVVELRENKTPDFYARFWCSPFNQSLPMKVNDYGDGSGRFYINVIAEYDIREKHSYEETQFTPNTHLLESGIQIYCPSKFLTEFRSKKHYAVDMELHNTELMVLDNTSYPIFALVNNLGEEALIYKPTCKTTDLLIKEDNSVVFRFEFDTIEGFNDSQDYYPAVLYKSDNSTEYIKTKLLSIVESDYEGNKDLVYADLVLDSVTIEVNDSSNAATNSAPIKMISATLSEQKDASAWATLMNKVEDTVIEGEANSAAVENLVNSARKNYQSILALKDSIFDPDGTCDKTFLQVMMMQIGADSMNYRMLKTSVDFDGKTHNCLIGEGSTDHYAFEAGSDTLYHYVYSQGAQGGTWEISQLSRVELDSKSVYYIALKCQREGLYGEWVCDTVQHKVDEDPGYWYFNWGILTCDSAGIYTLTETRGNAYMYGDNLVCGKISNLAKNCWFDLTNGDFVLGNSKSGAAFSYIDGVLHIGGLPTDSDIADLLIQIGVLNSKIDNIGGKNLLKQTAFHYNYVATAYAGFTKIYNLEAGKTYIATWGKFENNAGGATNEVFNGVCLGIGGTSFASTEQVIRFGEPFYVNGNGRFLSIIWCDYSYAKHMIGVDDYTGVETKNDFTQFLDYVMLQEGEVATAFQPSIDEELEVIEQLQEDFQESLDKINSDEYFSVAEKKIIRTNWEAISGLADTSSEPAYYEKPGSYAKVCDAVIYGNISTKGVDDAFEALRSFLDNGGINGLYVDTDWEWGANGRSTMAERFTAYYNEEVALWNAVNNAYADTKAFDDSSYRYLKEALVQDTDVVGGIVATSQIHLRDWTGKWVDANGVEYDTEGVDRTKQYVYNAGLSGMLEDGVLMWGGGDYIKATQQVQGLLSEIDKLPILLTKSGESSKIGCINVVNSTQVEITGSDNTKIIIDGGSQNASIQLVKNGTTYVKLTTDSIASSDVSQKALTNYIFEGEPLFLIHTTSSGAENKTICTLSLPADTYAVDYTDCSHIRVDFGLHLQINGPEVKNVKIKFDICIGSYVIGSCDATISSLQTNGSFTSNTVCIPKSMTTSRITGGSYDVTIKNAVVTCVYGGETKNMSCRITSVSFGKGSSISTWKDGDITFSSVAQQMVTIGQNGLQVVSSSGLIQIMSDKGKAYMKMQGLPTDEDIDTLNAGQLYVHEINFDNFKEKLATFVGEAYAAAIKGSFDENKEAMNNALSNQKCIAVKE